MMDKLTELMRKWSDENAALASVAKNEEVALFQKKTGFTIPDDMSRYFQTINGTGGECTDELYEFYSLDKFQNVIQTFERWEGVPDYREISHVLPEAESVFVFANFQFNLFVYAIKLHRTPASRNEVFVLCGSAYKVIAHSFSEFIDLYLADAIELQFNE